MPTNYAPFNHRFVIKRQDLAAFEHAARPLLTNIVDDQDGYLGMACYLIGARPDRLRALWALDCRSSIPSDLARSLLSS